MAYIQSIDTFVPPYKTTSRDIVDWAQTAYPTERDWRKFKFLVSRSGIDSRYSVVPDFLPQSESVLFNGATLNGEPGTAERLSVFHSRVMEMAASACRRAMEQGGIRPSDITHLIAVSCTGMRAPGLEIAVSHTLGLSQNVERSAINFMGCYAAFHAIRQAFYICNSHADAKVLVCCAEACTLHFKNSANDDDLLSTALFGDGAASMVISPEPGENMPSFEILRQSSRLINAPESMSWDIEDNGFLMKLSREVPEYIGRHIRQVHDDLLQKSGLDKVDFYAVHPGGKNILEAFSVALNLSEESLLSSYKVLRNYGNMSSPTVLFVLEEVKERFLDSGKNQALVFAAAFGPGLTIEAALLKLERKEK